MDGFEFASEALSLKRYELDIIVDLTEKSEVDWLEFKAAIRPQNPQEAAISNDADYIFHLVKALVSMTNGSGGLVVLGIDDDGNAVGLEKSGFTGDRDHFTRDISNKVLLQQGGWWRTQGSGRWRWKNSSDQLSFDPHWATYQGRDILAFTIRSRENSLGPLILENKRNGNEELKEIAFIRAGGDRGTVVRLSPDEVGSWWSQRDPTRFSTKFKAWITELKKTDPATFRATVNAYGQELIADTAELDHLYVPLEADVRIINKGSGQRRHQTDDSYLSSENPVDEPNSWRGEFQEVIKSVYPSFLIGEPGSGKSTSLLKLARDINSGSTSDLENWSLYIPLSGFTASGLQHLIYREVEPLNWADIVLGLDSGQLTLILDGLNECPSVHYDQCANELSDLFKEHPDSKIIVSTRSSHLPPFARKAIELRSMGASRQKQLVRNYLADTPESIEAFWEKLADKQTAKMIARSPILLRMALWVWKVTGELPGGLAELYSAFFDGWIRREMLKDLAAGETAIWTEDEAREALAVLAYSMRCDGIVACSKAEAKKRLCIAMGDRSKAFVNRMAQGLLIETARDGITVRFKHETIQEFLVAVFLTSHSEHKLLQAGHQFENNRWSMPIVFAFELFDQAPEHFVQTAWKIAPLLVCAALRDEKRLLRLPEPQGRYFAPQNDLWVRGVIRCMRGESVKEITHGLAYSGRTPSPGRYLQKHGLPEELTSALEGIAFWYALNSQELGLDRIERLQHLLIDRRNIWLELLPHAIVGQPEWLLHLTEAQKLLVGELEGGKRSEALASASVGELCYMARHRIITDQEFRENWKRTLNVENTEPLELEVLALLASKKIRATQFNGSQRSLIKQISKNRELSPRILKELVKDKIIQPEEIRKDRAHIKHLVDHASPLRTKQLLAWRILRYEDFSESQIRALLDRVENDKDIAYILGTGLIKSRQEIPKSIRDRAHRPKEKENESLTKPITRSAQANNRSSPAELLSDVYLSKEQKQLKILQRDALDPKNFEPGSGFQRVLADNVTASTNWPIPERDMLIDLAEAFYHEHAGKKRKKEYRDLIRSARDAVENGRLHKPDI
jgi:hypothetical protein